MAWNEPGNKRRDPWQSGGGGNEPDLDAMLKRMREGFGRVFGGGGGGGGGGGFWLLVLGVVAIWFAFDSWRAIDESEKGVVLRLGKFDRIMGPGLNLKWPSPIEQVFVVEATRVRSTSDEVKMLTRDENLVIVDFNVQYQVSDPRQYQFAVKDPDETLRQVSESAVREVVGASPMDVILSGERTALAETAQTALQEKLDLYGTGLTVTEFNFQNLRPPPEVKDAFDDAITAREDKQRIENEAQAYASKVLPEAGGQAARVRAEAQGDRDAAVAVAQGAADRFSMLVEQYKAAPEVTRKRLYLETMQEVLAGSPKVMVDADGDRVLYLPLEKLAPSTQLPTLYAEPSSSERAATTATPTIEALRDRDSDRGRRAERDR